MLHRRTLLEEHHCGRAGKGTDDLGALHGPQWEGPVGDRLSGDGLLSQLRGMHGREEDVPVGQCIFQNITEALDNSNHFFTSHIILSVFNISQGLITLPSECCTEQANLLRTQYMKLFLHISPVLLVLERDLDLELQTELIEGGLQAAVDY